MAIKSSKEKSLLECAVEAVQSYPKGQKPKSIYAIAADAMKIKGLKDEQGRELMPRFICDLMESGRFVYCGEGTWDLKENQPTSVLEKSVHDYDVYDPDAEVAAANELNGGEDTDVKPETPDDVNEIEPETQDEEEEDVIANLLNSSANDESTESDLVETGFEEETGEDDEDSDENE